MYELLRLIDFADVKSREGKQLALATIIHTIGSSYRKEGTQMMIADDLTYEGALSGGCVEKEVLRQSLNVFPSKQNVVFEYDGRYKLGCNGRIYILVEYLEKPILEEISARIRRHHESRKPITLEIRKDEALTKGDTGYLFNGTAIKISQTDALSDKSESVQIDPQKQLVIIGGEYDSVALANVADHTGIQTYLVVKEQFIHKLSKSVRMGFIKPEALQQTIQFDEQTAIVIMSHSLSKDLSYLVELVKVPSAYIGILGPKSRRDAVLNDFMNYNESLFLEFQDKLEQLHGPIGLHIGGRTPEEISISILSEVIQVFNFGNKKDQGVEHSAVKASE
jgi:xanthine dehydrogenase accessory factor